MVRQHASRVAFLVVAALVTVVMLPGRDARAQITANGGEFGFGNANVPGGTYDPASNIQVTGTIGAAFVSLGMTGDWIVHSARAAGVDTVTFEAELPFKVGNLPVQVSNFEQTYDAKWVNGGGTFLIPATNWNITSSIFESIPDRPFTVHTIHNGSQTGNGFKVDVGDDLAGVSYVLGSNTNYFLDITVTTTIDHTAWNNSFPSIIVTNEFGGTFGDPFEGFAASFNWITVPEPSSVALAGMAAVSLAAYAVRQRKR